MSDIDDLDFSSMLYQEWSKTTDAETSFWGMEPHPLYADLFRVFAVSEGMTNVSDGVLIASDLTEQDAAWITAVHGAFGDLMKRWQRALDEAENMECERDRVVAELGQAYLEIEQLKAGRA